MKYFFKEKEDLIAEWTPEPLVPDSPLDHHAFHPRIINGYNSNWNVWHEKITNNDFNIKKKQTVFFCLCKYTAKLCMNYDCNIWTG